MSPAQFIPLAEETGLDRADRRWVLRTACAQNVAWQKAGLPTVTMAVNLSARQLDDEALVRDDPERARANRACDPTLLELEITESMIMHDAERARGHSAATIKALGVRLAIDDFGTGYSSLAHLKRFPIDTLKIDRSFVRDIPSDAEDRAIAEAIIAMGKTLSLTVVAEGVETPEQQAFLSERACDEMQGYYFSTPVPPREFAALLVFVHADAASLASARSCVPALRPPSREHSASSRISVTEVTIARMPAPARESVRGKHANQTSTWPRRRDVDDRARLCAAVALAGLSWPWPGTRTRRPTGRG